MLTRRAGLLLVAWALAGAPAWSQSRSQWVPVDGHRLHLVVTGDTGPTIVLEAGAGSTHEIWNTVAPQLAAFGRVVAYDRPGFGQSEMCARPRTARAIAEELREALAAAGLPPPYLLVGWSFGGAIIRVFAGLYPREVTGLVLVDPVSETFYERAHREQKALFERLDGDDAPGPDAPPGERAELAGWDLSMRQAATLDRDLRAPAILLSSARTDLGAIGPIWVDEQRKWTARHPRATFVSVDGAGHAIQREQPAAVIKAVRDLLPAADEVYDLVIDGGRVVDPASGLDAIRSLGIRAGKIAAVSDRPLRGRERLDATGMVVAPGFIDLHQHAQHAEGYRVQALDGTTTALELEEGTADVDEWYASRVGRSLINHGVSVGHAYVRMRVMQDPGRSAPAGAAATDGANDRQLAAIRAAIDEGLRQGAVAVGLLIEYTPGARPWEVFEVFRAAAARNATVHVHLRSLEEPQYFLETEEIIAAAAASGASAHIVHIQSSGGDDTPRMLELIRGARARGIDVTTEVYPYTAAMTGIENPGYGDWESWPDSRFGRFEWPATGERLTRESFAKYRKAGGLVVDHANTESVVTEAIRDPLPMIASDGVLERGVGHPRVAGTFARVLGRYVRDLRVLTLMDALRRMTVEPARRLERRVPTMAFKGRLAPGADADIVVFDPATIADRATFREPTRPAEGIRDVLVGGTFVVRGGAVQEERFPGRAVRAQGR